MLAGFGTETESADVTTADVEAPASVDEGEDGSAVLAVVADGGVGSCPPTTTFEVVEDGAWEVTEAVVDESSVGALVESTEVESVGAC